MIDRYEEFNIGRWALDPELVVRYYLSDVFFLLKLLSDHKSELKNMQMFPYKGQMFFSLSFYDTIDRICQLIAMGEKYEGAVWAIAGSVRYMDGVHNACTSQHEHLF